MLNKKPNAKLLWMQFEDVLAPRLGLTVKERAVYSYLCAVTVSVSLRPSALNLFFAGLLYRCAFLSISRSAGEK